jgi:hypothetical protein
LSSGKLQKPLLLSGKAGEYEVSDTQQFWISLLRDVLGESHLEQAIQFEKRGKLEFL